MEPEQEVVGRAGHEIGHPDLARAERAGHDRERARLAGRRVSTGALGRVRTAPVERLVVEVGHRPERSRAPAEDPVVDLEPAPDQPLGARSGAVDDRVPGQAFADRDDVADGQAGRPVAVIVTPGVAQVGDDEVAGRPAAEVERDRPFDEDPASLTSARTEIERDAMEDLPAGRKTPERRSIRGMEPRAELVLGDVPGRLEVDGRGQPGDAHRGPLRPCRRSRY